MTQEELQWNLQWTEYERDMLREENDALRKEQAMNEKQTDVLYGYLKRWARLGYKYAADRFFISCEVKDGESFEDWRRRCLLHSLVPEDMTVNEVYAHTEQTLRQRYEERVAKGD